MKYVRKRREHVLVLVPHVSSWAYLHDRIYIMWDTIRSVWEWDVGLVYEQIFVSWKNTGPQSNSSQHTATTTFHFPSYSGCATESRLPLIFTLMLWANAGNTQMIHSAWLDTQQTLGSLIVRATSINNHISIHRSPARLALCATWFYFCQKDLNPSSSSGLSLYEKLSVIKR